MSEQVDVVVVGLGVGGEETAGRLAQAGLRVVGIESRLVGGECPYYGCIPSKMMIRAANLIAETRRVDGMAGTASVQPDWAPVAKRIREEATDTWNDKVAVDRLVNKGATVIKDFATITGPNTVRAGDREFEATRGIVIATGTIPAVPPIDGLAGTPFWTNREAIEVETLPATLLILGGGAIGMELAQVFARFGVQVTVIEGAPEVLSMEEPESGVLAREALERDGVTFLRGSHAQQVGYADDAFTVTLADGSSATGEKLLVATGRRIATADLGLDKVERGPRRGPGAGGRARRGRGPGVGGGGGRGGPSRR
ncbi:FAD-dependent oxidoreductase, partial [Kribbella sp. NPDC054772]